MLKILLTAGLLLSAAAMNAVASENERYEYREGSGYEANERYASEEREYRDRDDRYYERGERKYRDRGSYSVTPRNVSNDLYNKECGSCHFAYQSELLPRRSWVKMMGELENHFGTDASLEENDRLSIEKYLVQYAGDTPQATYKYYKKINRSIAPDDAPQRISETRYFVKEHREVPKRLIEQKAVKSISNCIACHKTADKGHYGERDIFIPNYGRWED